MGGEGGVSLSRIPRIPARSNAANTSLPHLPACILDLCTYPRTHPQECLSLPSDVARTNLKLVVSYDGWEFVVYERLLRTDPAQPADAAETPLLVTVGVGRAGAGAGMGMGTGQGGR